MIRICDKCKKEIEQDVNPDFILCKSCSKKAIENIKPHQDTSHLIFGRTPEEIARMQKSAPLR